MTLQGISSQICSLSICPLDCLSILRDVTCVCAGEGPVPGPSGENSAGWQLNKAPVDCSRGTFVPISSAGLRTSGRLDSSRKCHGEHFQTESRPPQRLKARCSGTFAPAPREPLVQEQHHLDGTRHQKGVPLRRGDNLEDICTKHCRLRVKKIQ